MKTKRKKRLLIVVGVVLGLIILFSAAFFIKIQSETGRMTPLETQAFIKDVYAVKDSYVNMFLVRGSSGYIAFDAGNNIDHVRQELGTLNIQTGEVAAVFLTHSDRDHIAALSLFENAVIYISGAETQMIDGQTPRFLFMHNSLALQPKRMEDGQVVTVSGMTVKGILTPGHTPGAMSYLVDGRYLFTGDSMGLTKGKVTTFNDLFNMDSERQRISLKQLAGLSGVEFIFTAHYGAAADWTGAFSGWVE